MYLVFIYSILNRQLLVIQINIFGFMASLAVKAGDAVNAERLYKEVS